MNIKSQVKMRWCGFASYQIVLEDGTVILTDPCQYGIEEKWTVEPDYRKYADRTMADILDRCDYILLSHTHFDHVDDLTYVLDKFPNARVIVPDGCALSLILEKNYSTLRRNIIPVGDRDKLCFPEFTLQCFRGKHTVFASNDPFFINLKEQNYREAFRMENGAPDLIRAMFEASGGLDFRNFVISTPDEMSVFIWAGQILEDFRRWQYHDMKPDVMFVQIAGTNIGGDRANPKAELIGDFTTDVQAKLVLPIHQEKFTKENMRLIKEQCGRYYAEHNSSASFENPEAYEWFSVLKYEDGSVCAKWD